MWDMVQTTIEAMAVKGTGGTMLVTGDPIMLPVALTEIHTIAATLNPRLEVIPETIIMAQV